MQIKTKNIKFMLGSFLALALLISAPSATFAENNGRNKNYRAEFKAELKAEKKDNDDKRGFFSRFWGWWGNRASAQNNTSVRVTSPSISGITAPTVLKTGAEGTWTVRASEPNNGTLSYSVDWGEGMMGAKALEEVFVQESTFTHAYAKAGTYKVKFTVKNEAGLKTTSTVTVRVTGEPMETAPVISDVKVVSENPRNAKLSWTTDVKSDSHVWIGTSSPVSTEGEANIVKKGKVGKHKINLKKLEPNTQYYVIVGSSNNAGRTLSAEVSFTTPDTAENTPKITGVEGPETVKVGAEATVTINAKDSKNGNLTYSADWGDTSSLARKAEAPFVQSATLSHIYSNPGTYDATFTVQNSLGNKDTASLKITVTADTGKPEISDIKVVPTESGGTISWTTNEPTTSKIFYSATSPVPVEGSSAVSVDDDTLRTEHSLSLSGLDADKLYYYIIKSMDAWDNFMLSAEGEFTTLEAEEE